MNLHRQISQTQLTFLEQAVQVPNNEAVLIPRNKANDKPEQKAIVSRINNDVDYLINLDLISDVTEQYIRAKGVPRILGNRDFRMVAATDAAYLMFYECENHKMSVA